MNFRAAFRVVVLAFYCAVAYVVWPFWSAYSIRQAIENEDTEYLEQAIEWDSVKATLKPSLVAYAVDRPPDGRRSGLLRRARAYYGRRMVNKFVDVYVTPQGLPELFQHGQTYREQIKRQVDDTASLPRNERAARAWRRLKRAEFTSPARLEVEVEDRFIPERRYTGVLELKEFRWKLTELRVFGVAPPPVEEEREEDELNDEDGEDAPAPATSEDSDDEVTAAPGEEDSGSDPP